MNRKEYIEKLEVIRAAILNLHAEFTAAAITDENDIEAARRKAAGGLFDKLNTQLYENGAVSFRIMDDNAKAGLGEQCDLFDEARRESAENGDQGEEDRPAELLDNGSGITDKDFRVAKEDEERRAKERKAKAKGKGKTKKGAK